MRLLESERQSDNVLRNLLIEEICVETENSLRPQEDDDDDGKRAKTGKI